jgi:flagellar L-ring protein precursor FlgH
MDIVTIVINERSEGRKKAETDSETKFSLLLAIKSFFGLETKKWVSNNAALDPESLVSASSESKFEGQGETKRSGALTAKLSAVVLETLPNGLLRVEGSKIVSVDREEEVMVISGLVRPRDIAANNEVDSSRVANMRIDFYGRGVIGDTTSPGWLARIFSKVWPF